MENSNNIENLENLENNNMVVCEHCGQQINKENAKEVGGNYYCDECFEELFFVCSNCGEITSIDYCYEVEGDQLCENCVDELARFCTNCEEYHYIENMTETTEGDYVCDNCIDNGNNGWRVCDDCGHAFDSEREGILTASGDVVCGICSENYYYCDGCGEYYSEGEIHATDDGYYCDDCYEEHEDEENGELNSYNYKPQLKIYKTGNEKEKDLYIGFELETEQGSSSTSRDTMCKLLNKEINKDDTFIYFKTDSSLNYGIEVVSHAFTWEYYKENKQKLEKMLKILSENGYRSHDTSTCGLHVHINKKFFGNTTEEQNTNIDKLILFFEYFKDQIKIFSRRNDFHYCNFLSDKKGITEKKAICNLEKIKNIKYSTDRYVTVNIENSNTVEIRVFKGTLKPESFFASLEFVFNVARVIKENDIDKITFSKVVNYAGSTYIKDYCKERGVVYNYNYLHDYSIEFLRNKTKLEKKAKQLIKNAYALPKQILPIAKMQLPKIYSEIEKAIKNGERIKNCFGQYDLIDKFNYTNNIILQCYLLQDYKTKAKCNDFGLYRELQEVRDFLKNNKNYLQTNMIINNYTKEYLKTDELYRSTKKLVEESREYYKN